LLLLAADGDIQHINCAARNMLDRSSIFGFRHNKIHIRRKEETAAFLRAVQSMGSLSTRAQATSTIVNLHSREGCIVASLLMRSLISRGFAGLIILRIADFTSRPTRHITWIADIFGLTPTESKIANGLLEGLTINDIAVREGNAVDTVRGHVKRAMAKVSAHSQAQFVSMLMRAHMALVNPDTDDHAGAHWF
jgi:DNA-binding CsgD family transcriptional regulator